MNTVYITDNRALADEVVYVTGTRTLADEVVLVTDNRALAGKVVYVTGSRVLADKVIYIDGSHALAGERLPPGTRTETGKTGPQIAITRAQLSQQKVDAIVNAAASVAALASGASAFIWGWDRRQRKELESLARHERVAAGRAVAGSPGKLPARWVIHTVHPAGADSDEDVALLASCYRESLTVAADLGARSIGFAKMTWPDSDAAARSRAATVAISEAMAAPDPVDHVVFASPDPVMIQMYGAAYDSLSQ